MIKKKSGEPTIKKMKNTSAVIPEDSSIYKKKYYKIVLHSIDRHKETPESFSIKMAMRLRTPMPRVKQILRRLPCTIKSGLSVSQANKLFSIMEELGAKVTMEDYFLTPGKSGARAPMVDGLLSKSTQLGNASSFDCPSCGWENEAGADHCVLCLKIFRRPQKKVVSEPSAVEAAADAPADPATGRPTIPAAGTQEDRPAGIIIVPRRWIVLAGTLFILLLIILLLK
jgi:hypothetical protein